MTSHHHSQSDPSISPKDFEHFYLAKSYDVIGQGSFRKHLCKCKEAGDSWALEMNQGLGKIQATIKQIQSRIAQIGRAHV